MLLARIRIAICHCLARPTVRDSVAVALMLSVLGGGAGPAGALDFRLLQLDGAYLKWGDPAFGTPAQVSYALLAGERHDPAGINCRHMTGLAPLRERTGITDAVFHRELRAAFDVWRDAAGLSFVAVADAAHADIVIGVQITPRGIAWTNVDYATREGERVARLTGAAICLNPEVVWETENDDDLDTYNLRRVLAHEIGHTLGLNHPGPRGQLMGYAYTDDSSALRPGDLTGIRTLYGPPVERR